MKILIEDITSSPTEVHFVEAVEELNRVLANQSRHPGTQASEPDYQLTTPLDVSLTHLRSGQDLLLSGVIRGEFIGRCVRCLEEAAGDLARQFSLVLTPRCPVGRDVELNHEELSASFYTGEQIDLSVLMQEQVLLALPSQAVCQEECRGLCAQCGTNLNHEQCECRLVWKDPRLAVLSTLRMSSPKMAK